MARYRVLEIETVVKEYEVDAENRDSAIVKVHNGVNVGVVRERVIGREYETENLTLLEALKAGG